MINICIIEDNDDHYAEITRHLRKCKTLLNTDQEREINIFGLTTSEHSPNEIVPYFKKHEIDILLLDYDLRWEQKRSFNGLKLLERLIDGNINLPYVFFTSSLFERQPDIVGKFVNDGHSNTFSYRTLPKHDFMNDENTDSTVRHILEAIRIIPIKISFDLYEYPLHNPKSYSNITFTYKALLDKGVIKDFYTTSLSPDQFLMFIPSEKSKWFLLFHISTDGNIILSMLKDIDGYTGQMLRNKLKKISYTFRTCRKNHV